MDHVSGYLDCETQEPNRRSLWGCGPPYEKLMTVITDNQNQIIFPKPASTTHLETGIWFYKMAGYKHDSPNLTLIDIQSPMYARKGQELRIWYGEDLLNGYEVNNGGSHCVRVSAKFSKC